MYFEYFFISLLFFKKKSWNWLKTRNIYKWRIWSPQKKLLFFTNNDVLQNELNFTNRAKICHRLASKPDLWFALSVHYPFKLTGFTTEEEISLIWPYWSYERHMPYESLLTPLKIIKLLKVNKKLKKEKHNKVFKYTFKTQ